MKGSIASGVGFVTLVFLSFLLMGSRSKTDSDPRTITATGSGKVAYDPDSARLFFNVSATKKTPTAARKETARLMAELRNALVALKIASLKTKTRNVTLSEVYGKASDEQSPRPVVGYEVEHVISVLVSEPDVDQLNKLASQVLDTALENGVRQANDISFFKQDVSEEKWQAMQLAVANAMDNAKAFANGANVQIGSVNQIDGGSISRGDLNNRWWGGQQGQGGIFGARQDVSTSFSVGRSEISCNAKVVCTIR